MTVAGQGQGALRRDTGMRFGTERDWLVERGIRENWGVEFADAVRTAMAERRTKSPDQADDKCKAAEYQERAQSLRENARGVLDGKTRRELLSQADECEAIAAALAAKLPRGKSKGTLRCTRGSRRERSGLLRLEHVLGRHFVP
jgi:hypothetical protein